MKGLFAGEKDGQESEEMVGGLVGSLPLLLVFGLPVEHRLVQRGILSQIQQQTDLLVHIPRHEHRSKHVSRLSLGKVEFSLRWSSSMLMVMFRLFGGQPDRRIVGLTNAFDQQLSELFDQRLKVKRRESLSPTEIDEKTTSRTCRMVSRDLM